MAQTLIRKSGIWFDGLSEKTGKKSRRREAIETLAMIQHFDNHEGRIVPLNLLSANSAMMRAMILGEIVGTVWGARHALGLAGVKLVVVRPVNGGRELLAADKIGANVGETVIVSNGSRVRDIVFDANTPIKTVVVGIVDGVDT